eukprot:TRINITY_DN15115_c0_g1_i1.p2 TRINITY_DN15115_c0_g1~~TRINITY_DN15115_c0_g1_i1.p2  ORF type:complete len:113 (-),score=25.72 TRINITY_DN15115_c0_g1_i1:414-752(-)
MISDVHRMTHSNDDYGIYRHALSSVPLPAVPIMTVYAFDMMAMEERKTGGSFRHSGNAQQRRTSGEQYGGAVFLDMAWMMERASMVDYFGQFQSVGYEFAERAELIGLLRSL